VELLARCLQELTVPWDCTKLRPASSLYGCSRNVSNLKDRE
jgi:hypothetical protein